MERNERLSGLNYRLITFLCDSTTTSVRDDVIDFIHNDLKPVELLSIEAMTMGTVEKIQDFTADQTALLAAVNKLLTAVVNESAPLAKIETLCRRLPAATKKSLLYFSAAFEPPGAVRDAELDSAANACTRANVAIYPIGAPSASIAELPLRSFQLKQEDRRSMIVSLQLTRRAANPKPITSWATTARTTSATPLSKGSSEANGPRLRAGEARLLARLFRRLGSAKGH